MTVWGHDTGISAPLLRAFNGTILETFDALVTSNGTVVTMSLEQSGGGDLTMVFSDDFTILDTTPALTLTLTAGSDASPTENFVYIPQSTKVLTLSTSDWPSAEHIKIAYFLVPSATFVQASGVYINQNWNDHATGTDNQGHITHMAERSRRLGPIYKSGVDGNGTTSYLTITTNVGVPDNVAVQTTSGVVYQMHKQTYPAKDTSSGDTILVVNDSVTAYDDITDLNSLLTDADGDSMSTKYFNLVLWGVVNKSGEFGPLMVNLPTGSYNNQSDAQNDVDGEDVFTIPAPFATESTTGFLIARITLRHQNASGGTWTHVGTVDIRGLDPQVAKGSGTGIAQSEFADNVFRVFDESDVTKIMAWDAGTNITTGNTRTFQALDTDGVMAVSDAVLTSGSIPFINSSTLLDEDPTNIFWDQTSNANYLRLGSGTAGGEIRLLEGSGGGTSYTGFKAPATLAENVLYTLPLVKGSASDFLQTDGSGILIWATVPASAPPDASYVVLGVDGTLTDERVLTGTANQITVTDGGAGSTVTLATPQDIATGSSPTFAGLTLSGFSTGSILFMAAGGVITEDVTELFWNPSLARLGIGLNTAGAGIHLKSPAASAHQALYVDQDANLEAIWIDTVQTTTNAFTIPNTTVTEGNLINATCTTLTTGSVANLTANSSQAHTRAIVNIHQDHASASGAVALKVTQDSSANAVQFFDGSTQAWTLSNGGIVHMGSTTANEHFGQTLVINKSGGTHGGMTLNTYGAGSGIAPILDLRASNSNTMGAHSIESDQSNLGYIVWGGSDGSAFQDASLLVTKVDGTSSAGDMPGMFVFSPRARGAGGVSEKVWIRHNGYVGIGSSTTSGVLHVDQSSTTAAVPVLYLDQADVSEEMIEFNTTIGTGNAIEAIAAKSLTTTHFIKVTIPGGLTRYIPVGTIA